MYSLYRVGVTKTPTHAQGISKTIVHKMKAMASIGVTYLRVHSASTKITVSRVGPAQQS